jgi:hypothetical protein
MKRSAAGAPIASPRPRGCCLLRCELAPVEGPIPGRAGGCGPGVMSCFLLVAGVSGRDAGVEVIDAVIFR